jgi:hypothetical protein
LKRPVVRLIQLPVPPPAAFGATGNGSLAPGGLAAAAKARGLLRRLRLEVVPPDEADALGDAALAARLADGAPALVGFSLCLWSVERSLHLAREVKRLSPETLVAVGGPEVEPDNAFLLSQGGFDIAVSGEGEEAFVRILRALPVLPVPGSVPGAAVRSAAGLSPFAAAKPASFPLSRYPSPYDAGLLPVSPDRSAYLETARGCRARCSFCFYSGRRTAVRALPAAAVAASVRRLARLGAREVYLLDPTFNRRSDFRRVLEALARANRGRELSFFAELSAERLSIAEMDLLARAGFTGVEIGLQSVRAETLRRARRGGSPEAVARAACGLKARGIAPLVDLIVGLPGDREEDVRAGIEFLVRRGLAAEAQVMPLLVLPGTELRRRAAEDGVVFDPAPPYRAIRTREMDEAALRRALEFAEEALGRPMEEFPRPHLVSREGAPTPPDVFSADLDGTEAEVLAAVSAPGARHAALWLSARDLWRRRDLARRAVEARIATDPFSTLDVVVLARCPFPLDLVDLLKETAALPEWYLTRVLAPGGANAARRVCAVIPRGARPPADWVEALRAEAPVFREMTLDEALRAPGELGDAFPAARIREGPAFGRAESVRELARRADPEAVAFASRRWERWWTEQVLRYDDARGGP